MTKEFTFKEFTQRNWHLFNMKWSPPQPLQTFGTRLTLKDENLFSSQSQYASFNSHSTVKCVIRDSLSLKGYAKVNQLVIALMKIVILLRKSFKRNQNWNVT